MKYSRILGFHFIELLITLSIISILASISIPLYSQYVIKAKRVSAREKLSKLALALEQYHTTCNTYENANLAKLKFHAGDLKNDYEFKIKIADENYFLLTAQPIGVQAKDNCGALTLDSKGQQKKCHTTRMRGTYA